MSLFRKGSTGEYALGFAQNGILPPGARQVGFGRSQYTERNSAIETIEAFGKRLPLCSIAGTVRITSCLDHL